MNKTIWIAFVALSALASVGCKKKGADGGSGDAVAKMTELKNKMCACSAGDKACADKVNEDMKKWSDEHAKGGGHASDPATAQKLEPISREFGECMTKAMTAAADPAGAGATGAGSAMGSDHAGHGSAHGSGSAMGSAHGGMRHEGMQHGSGHGGSE